MSAWDALRGVSHFVCFPETKGECVMKKTEIKKLVLAGILIAVLRGGTRASYTPELMVTGYNDPWLWVGSICWFVFLSIPVAVDVVEEMRWHVLRSKI